MPLYMDAKTKQLLRNIQKKQDQISKLQEEEAELKDTLKAHIISLEGEGVIGNYKKASEAGSISWIIPKAPTRFDARAFEIDHPELYQEYLKQSTQEPKPQLRVTFKKD